VLNHADHRSVSSRQLGRQQQMPDIYTSWDCVEAQRGNDAWQNKDVIDWPRHKLECSSPSSTGSLVMKAFMHRRQKLELHISQHYWNGLSASIRTATSLHSFCRQLKAFLYRQSTWTFH